jgi:hypothetical protein
VGRKKQKRKPTAQVLRERRFETPATSQQGGRFSLNGAVGFAFASWVAKQHRRAGDVTEPAPRSLGAAPKPLGMQVIMTAGLVIAVLTACGCLV